MRKIHYVQKKALLDSASSDYSWLDICDCALSSSRAFRVGKSIKLWKWRKPSVFSPTCKIKKLWAKKLVIQLTAWLAANGIRIGESCSYGQREGGWKNLFLTSCSHVLDSCNADNLSRETFQIQWIYLVLTEQNENKAHSLKRRHFTFIFPSAPYYLQILLSFLATAQQRFANH